MSCEVEPARQNHQQNNQQCIKWAGKANMCLKKLFSFKMPVLGQIWPFLGPKSNFLGAGSKNFGTLVSGFQWDTFFVLKTLIGEAPIGR